MYPIPPTEHLVEIKKCRQCACEFPITDKDMEFYSKVSPSFSEKKYIIPPPTLCPDCRQQRRLAFRNERKLYKRKCDATGKDIISIYSPDKPYTVYHQDYWWSDAWDPMSYGREFDFMRSAMEQFGALLEVIPKLALSVEKQENSEYTNYAGWNKDCYLIFLGANNENCHYCSGVWDSKNTLDSTNSQRVNESYELIDSSDCYNSSYLQYSQDCRDCHFGSNLVNCRNCLFSLNLHNQEYHVLNKKITKEQYEKIIADKNQMLKLKSEYELLKFSEPRKENSNVSTENSTGNNLRNSQNILSSFDVTDSKDCKYVGWMFRSKDCYDVYDWGATAERCYECHKVGDSASSILFSAFCLSQVNNLFYCYDCTNGTSHCFGCVGLRNKSYCILNYQYTKEEYEFLVPRIIEKMISDGEWGEFFPASLSPFGYNETVAQEYFPLTKEEALRDGLFNWSDYEAPFPKVEKIIPAEKLPDTIESIPDDILNWAIECEVSKKPFRIIKQELEFYRKHNIPIPRRHPDVRHMDRMKMRNPRKLFERLCDCEQCEENWRKKDAQIQTEDAKESFFFNPKTKTRTKKMITTYSPERPETVYCEVCYEREVVG